MPIYEWICRHCQNQFERLQVPGRAYGPPVCPRCGQEAQLQMSAPAIAKLATPAYGSKNA